MSKHSSFWKTLGPGLLWAGAAIGVSHLVQSTRAGAGYGFSLVILVLLANLFKYPFFEYGPRYAAATKESLLQGYLKLGRWAVYVFLFITLATMFTIQAAVTVVTAGLAGFLIGDFFNTLEWTMAILAFCAVLLIWGKYPLLDKVVKFIIVLLSLSTLVAFLAALVKGGRPPVENKPVDLTSPESLAFMIALMGWMPSAIDISVWNSLWTLERAKETEYHPTPKEASLDFNIGYIGTVIIALLFLSLGALIMHGSGETFSNKAPVFAGQIITLYTQSLGEWSRPIIGIAAFATMFSTTITCLDAFPRVLTHTIQILVPRTKTYRKRLYWPTLLTVAVGSVLLLSQFAQRMTAMIDLATILSFLVAPILAIINYKVITGPWMPESARPGTIMKNLSKLGILFLTLFSLWYLYRRFL